VVAYLALGVLLLVGLLAAAHWFVNANARMLVRVLVGLVVVLAVGGGIFLAFTGRLLPAVAAGVALLPFIMRSLAQYRRARAYAGPRPGQNSTIETPTLRVRLDHESGEVTGEVRKGRFAGRRLEDLGPGELVILLSECRTDDAQAAAILEAFLDRSHPGWRDGAAQGEGAACRGPRPMRFWALSPGPTRRPSARPTGP
jgi:hypothetical protein